jgi:hypothetical protein
VVSETVTCKFMFSKAVQTCSSSKGRCSAAPTSPTAPQCAIQVRGSPGESVNWTSTCARPASVTTTMDGNAESAVFTCTPLRLPITMQRAGYQ